MKVIKRSGKIVDFKKHKITNAVENVFKEVGNTGYDARIVTSEVIEKLDDEMPHVEVIQDAVEDVLIELGYKKSAKAYIRYREQRKRERKEWLKAEMPLDIYQRKYQFKNESFSETIDRIAGGNETIRKEIKNKNFLPAGRIIANRGLSDKGVKATLSNCYVTKSPKDNIESIYKSAAEAARTFSYGGGTGIDISNLRPKGAKVNNTAKTTTGPISFMSLYDVTSEKIGQKGRRAALMLSLDVSHPDIIDFIEKKTDLEEINKANISVKITDDFMLKAIKGEDYKLSFTVEATGEVLTKIVDADRVLNVLAYSNWYSGEPGCLFWDRINNWYLLSEDENHQYETTNPCGEKPLLEDLSCNLGSINLANLVRNPYTENAYFDYDYFEKLVEEGVTYLNEILDEGVELHPLKEQREQVKKWRPIGLGVMGLGTMFIKLGIKYGSPKSIELSERLGSIMINEALKTSAKLAKEQGTYPAFNKEAVMKSPFFQENADEETKEIVSEFGLRNSELLSIAPTGSISNLCQVTGGIEPLYQVSYTRKTESLHGEDREYKVFSPVVKEIMEEKGIEKVEDLPDYIVSTHDIHYKDRIGVQAAWQKYIDSSISSTVNLPNETTIKDVKKLYVDAWEKGLKGITVFRNNCARIGILSSGEIEGKTEMTDSDFIDAGICPECKVRLANVSGCKECKNCGFEVCSV